ncbi:DUF86 domain-containing protein [Microbacterium protaetiae]|uniref:DUF86 domain-containing protein n=1 Tax=Microbacterium protaetiae TaxID=2509458 RepID=A0A4P6EMX9_9MICO|nr:HepT-like ribonuclease domain-containing protein [Microbacterium protaetiae]QAY59238.1 DUF86 domain-containing protein [Microbacterium protaetiae]
MRFLTPIALRSFASAQKSLGLAAESIIIKIGENVARLSAETIVANPQVPWSSIKRMHDRFAHRYEVTDYDAVWATINVDLPRVRAAIASLLP